MARQGRAGAGGEPSGMSYLLTALALTVGVALIAGAVALILRGDPRNAVRILKTVKGDNHPDYARGLNNLGLVYRGLGRAD